MLHIYLPLEGIHFLYYFALYLINFNEVILQSLRIILHSNTLFKATKKVENIAVDDKICNQRFMLKMVLTLTINKYKLKMIYYERNYLIDYDENFEDNNLTRV